MRATETIRAIMTEKKIRVSDIAEITGKHPQTIYNTFQNDRHSKRGGMTFENAVMLFEALGCEVLIRDKETGKIY